MGGPFSSVKPRALCARPNRSRTVVVVARTLVDSYVAARRHSAFVLRLPSWRLVFSDQTPQLEPRLQMSQGGLPGESNRPHCQRKSASDRPQSRAGCLSAQPDDSQIIFV